MREGMWLGDDDRIAIAGVVDPSRAVHTNQVSDAEIKPGPCRPALEVVAKGELEPADRHAGVTVIKPRAREQPSAAGIEAGGQPVMRRCATDVGERPDAHPVVARGEVAAGRRQTSLVRSGRQDAYFVANPREERGVIVLHEDEIFAIALMHGADWPGDREPPRDRECFSVEYEDEASDVLVEGAIDEDARAVSADMPLRAAFLGARQLDARRAGRANQERGAPAVGLGRAGSDCAAAARRREDPARCAPPRVTTPSAADRGAAPRALGRSDGTCRAPSPARRRTRSSGP